MSEEPQFRSVLRGFDPEQVRSAMDELQTSVVTARRIAADRTIELTRMQEHLTQVQRDLDQALARIDEMESRPTPSAPTPGDVGARIGSILALANEEAEELRAAGREEARRQLDEADAAITAARAETEQHVNEVRAQARDDATRIVDEARHQASDLRAEAARDAQDRRAEAQAIVDSHRAQADAVAEFSSHIAKHTERLQLAQTRVEQLAREEGALVESQAQENAERIQRDMENQLAAVDARRESITSQLTTVGVLLRELAGAVGAAPHGEGNDESGAQVVAATGPSREATDDVSGDIRDGVPDVVEMTEHAFDHAADSPAPADASADASRHEEAGARR